MSCRNWRISITKACNAWVSGDAVWAHAAVAIIKAIAARNMR
jgi:hypothetical protein